MSITKCLLLSALFFPLFIFAQQNPSSLKWNSIETNHFEVVYPLETEETALKVANELEFVYRPAAASLDTLPSKITIFLYNQSTVSNGFVRLFPRYSAWYTTPNTDPTDLGNDNWLRSMGIHEYRHVVQFDKANQKFTKRVSWLLGDFARTACAWSVPFWFTEGDAVVTETALTKEGRGRMPSFDMPIRANLLEKRKASYEQAYLGSYRKYFPNHYHLGYHMVSAAKRKHGAKIWSKIIDKYSSYPFYPFAFSLAEKRLTNLNNRKLYRFTMLELDSLWKKQLQQKDFKQGKRITKQTKTWTNYTFPQWVGDSSFVALKYGYGHARQLVKIGLDGKEKYLCRLPSEQMHAAAGKVVWTEPKSSLRWLLKDFQNIVIYNLENRKWKRITKKGKFFSPALSPNGKQVVAVEYTKTLKSSLVFIDIETEKITKRKTIGDNETIRTPQWSEDGKSVVFTHSKLKGAALSVFYLDEDRTMEILPHSWEIIGWPCFSGDVILYESNHSGENAVYAIDPKSKKQWQVLSGKYGVFRPSIVNGKLLYQDYNADGHGISTLKIEKEAWIPKEQVSNVGVKYYEPIVKEEGGAVYNGEIKQKSFTSEKYPWYKGLINFHSLSIMPEPSGIGLFALSRNKLNTFDLKLGAIWDDNEKLPIYKVSSSFKQIFPIFSLEAQYRKREALARLDQKRTERVRWHQTDLFAGVELPFNFSSGEWTRQLSLNNLYQHSVYQRAGQGEYPFNINDRNLMNHNLSFYSIRSAAYKDIGYRLGFFSSVSVKYSVDDKSQLLSLRNRLYLPGFFKHHAMTVELSNERKEDSGYPFSSSISFPRGYAYFFAKETDLLKVDYSLPLFYPDLRIGSLLYINRVQGTVFYDKAIVNDLDLESLGGELKFDHYWFQIKVPITLGVRFSRRLYDNTNRVEAIIGYPMGFY